MKKNHMGTIKDIQKINRDVYTLNILTSNLNIEPGEYISILCEGLTLRRPFSVFNFEDNVLTILVKKRGKGTEYISNLKVGDKIEFSAPLGNTFKIENKKTLLIGAGIGVAPLIYLNKKLKAKDALTYLAVGYLNNKNSISTIKADFVATDDGSNGIKGSICDYIEQLINDFKPEKLVSCAPKAVLKCVADAARKYNIESEICMEKTMACGIGVCRGCVIKTTNGNKTVCKDGPVFSGAEVIWQ